MKYYFSVKILGEKSTESYSYKGILMAVSCRDHFLLLRYYYHYYYQLSRIVATASSNQYSSR